MPAPPLPPDEADRLAALESFCVLDTPDEPEFDDLTRLAAAACDVPIALVSLIDRDRQWFKSRVGLDVQQTPRNVAFCASAILGNEVFVVSNTLKDPRFRENPLVTGPPDIRFYAGAPIITRGGRKVGTVCVIDTKPRTLSPRERLVLESLARSAADLLENRATVSRLHEELDDREAVERTLRAELAPAGGALPRRFTRAELRPSPLSLFFMVLAALLLISSTVALYRSEQRRIHAEYHFQFERNAAFTTEAILRRVDDYSQLLQSGRAFFNVSGGEVSAGRWKEFVESLDVSNRYPGITGAGFIQFVPASERESFLSHARAEHPLFAIRPEGARSDYFVIRYVEPERVNGQAVGLDIGSEAVRRAAAIRADQLDHAAMTDPIVLVQDRDGKPGFLMLLPVRRAGRSLAGWTYIAVRYEDFFRSLRATHSDEIALTVTSKSAPSLIYRSGQADHRSKAVIRHPLNLLGSTVELEFRPTEGMFAGAERREPLLIGVAGTLLTIFVVVVLWFFATTRARALVLAASMTKAFRRGERNLSDLVESIADGVITIDADSRVKTFSRAASEIFGYESRDVQGKQLSFLLPEFRPEMSSARTPELVALRSDGTQRIVELSWGQLQQETNVATVVIARDVTEKRRGEREMQIVQTFALNASRAADEDELLETALAEICSYVECPLGEVWLPLGDRLVRARSWHHETDALLSFDAFSETLSFERGEGLPGLAWASGQPVSLSSLHDAVFRRIEAAEKAGLNSGFAIPVIADTKVVAVLSFFRGEPDTQPDQRHLKVVGTIAAQLADAMRSKRAEAALRESEERYRDLFENASDLIQSVSPEGRFLYVNDAWLRVLGYRREQLGSMSIFDIIHPDEKEHCQELFERLMGGDSLGRIETRFVTSDGDSRIVEGTVSCRSAGGQILSTRSIFRDVTEERMAQQAVAESRDRLRAVLDGAAEVSIIALDRSGVITLFNRGSENMLGYGAEEVIGKATPELFHDPEESRQRMLDAEKEFGPGDHPFDLLVARPLRGLSDEFEATYIRKDGERLTVSLSVSGVRDVAGNVGGFVGIARDITAVKAAEQALAESRDQFRASQQGLQSLMENSLDGIITFTSASVIEMANPAAERILGYEAGELASQPLEKLVPSQVADPAAFLRESYRRSHNQVSEWTVRRKSGENVPLELALFEFQTAGGPRFAAMFQDLSRRKEVERLKKEFVSTVSHELRTPLTSIRGSLDLLAGGVFGELPGEAQEVIGIAHKNSTRLISLINDILDLDRLDNGRLDMAITDTDVEQMIRTAVDAVKAFADQQQIAIEVRATSARVAADSDRIVQVLVNLLSNAVKFSQGRSTIRVSVQAGEEWVTLRVADEGRGIPARFKDRVFDRFQQVDSTDARGKGGSGLGLAICKSIVEEHGGRIGVETIEGKGSTFWFKLRRATEKAEPKGRLGSKTILIRRGDHFSPESLELVIANLGFAVLEANDQERICELVRGGAVDLAVIDVNAPGTEALLMALRKDSARVPVIFVGDRAPLDAASLAADGYFMVDLEDPHDLVTTVRSILRTGERSDVLVVEDDQELLRVISSQLGAEGIDVRTATTAEGAIAEVRVSAPRLIVLDVGLPDGDSFDVIRELQASEEFRDLAVLVYTGRYLNGSEKRLLTLGPTRFLTKSKASDEEFRNVVLSMLAEA